MATYFAKFSTGKKGTATEHSRYDARQGKWQSRNDLVSVDYDNMPDWAESDPIRLWKAADSYVNLDARFSAEVPATAPASDGGGVAALFMTGPRCPLG